MNNDVIKLLPDSVANQIAAGEVIQRPASVIKELVENSIDAGATSIQIILKDAGRTLIQVVDNGKGMSPTDARMAFERHATSKISSADDLYSLHTMGFRGEALPSIAAVAQIELRTMRKGDEVGSRLLISESKFVSQEPTSGVPGTNIMVKNLFFHMPARYKFLKKDSVELSHILHEFERLALVNTGVEFTIIHNDTMLHKLPAANLKQRITELFGKSVGQQLIPISTETSMVKINGFIGVPRAAKRRNVPQFFFVNGRNMRHPLFHKAVTGCYDQLIAPDVMPAYFINFDVDPATIDVNIHPQKHEIKFENEFPIRQILVAAVKQALGKINAAGAIDFDGDQMLDIPVFLPDPQAAMPGIDLDTNYNPFDESIDTSLDRRIERRSAATPIQSMSKVNSGARTSVPQDWDKLYESFTTRRDAPTPEAPEDTAPMVITSAMSTPAKAPTPSELPLESTEQMANLSINNKYIVVPARDGMLVIDRRRAHIRVLYNRFMAQLSKSQLSSQKLIFPETITLSPSRSAILSSITSVVAQLGYDVSFLGDNTWAINSVPVLPGHANPSETLSAMVADIEETGEIPEEGVLGPAALSLARSAAIAPGQQLTSEEIESLMAELFTASEPAHTPDGLKTFVRITYADLGKLFT